MWSKVLQEFIQKILKHAGFKKITNDLSCQNYQLNVTAIR